MNKNLALALFLVSSLVVSSILILDTVEPTEVKDEGLKTFNSLWELDSYIEKGFKNPKRGGPIFMEAAMDEAAGVPGAASEFSETNIQKLIAINIMRHACKSMTASNNPSTVVKALNLAGYLLS